jgi:hypothetical protein
MSPLEWVPNNKNADNMSIRKLLSTQNKFIYDLIIKMNLNIRTCSMVNPKNWEMKL